MYSNIKVYQKYLATSIKVGFNNKNKKIKKFPCLKYMLYSTEVQLDICQEYVSQIQGYRW